MKKYKKYIIMVIVALFIEIICFNFNSIISLFYEEVNCKFYYGENFLYENDYYRTEGSDTEYNYTIEIFDIDDYVYNIYLDVYTEIGENQKPLEYVVTISDEGSDVLYWNPTRVVLNNEASKYIKINSSGKTNRIVLEFDKESNSKMYIYDIKLNQKKPLNISKIRLLLILGILFLFSIFNNKSKTYELNNKLLKKIIVVFLIILQLLLLFNITTLNDRNLIIQDSFKANTEYQLLTHSLADGKLYLDLEVSDELKNMDNPYDYLYKINNSIKFNFDFCYYNEKYYVYFGVAPAIIFFLPYYLLTGNDLMNYQVIFFTLSLFSIGIFLLLNEIIKKYFKSTPFIMYLLLSEVLILCSGIIELAKNTNIYAVPIASGLCFMIWGLYFWLKSSHNNLNKFYLIVGSFFMALVFGCRPQLGISSLLVFFIFNKNSKNYKDIIIGILPFIIIGTLLMYYNYARFGSILDFGSNYNLTVNDMTNRGFKFDRIGLGLFTYLIQPVNVTGTFPYISSVHTSFNYLGRTVYEQTFGGLFTWFPLGFLTIFIYKIKKYFTNIRIYYLSILLSLFSLIIILFDTQCAGILQRYFADFSIFILMSTVFCILTLINAIKNKNLHYFIFIFCLIGIIYSLMLVFVQDFAAIEIYNLDFYYKWYYLLQPWL